jgi:hypothetical protein
VQEVLVQRKVYDLSKASKILNILHVHRIPYAVTCVVHYGQRDHADGMEWEFDYEPEKLVDALMEYIPEKIEEP